MTDAPFIPERIELESGVPGLWLVHFVNEILTDSGAPIDGRWTVTHGDSDMAIQSCGIGFRTLHAAAHFAKRLEPLIDWTVSADELKKRAAERGEFSKGIRHAEGHAHEVDATWPAGAVIPFSNGPSIVDDTGDHRKFMAQAPMLDFEKDTEGGRVCAVCGDPAVVLYEY